MAAPRHNAALTKSLLEHLQSDLRTLSSDCKRKYPPVKEAAEACLLKIRNIQSKSSNVIAGLLSSSTEIIQPFILGCDTKNPKIVHNCLTSIQRLIQAEAVSMPAANSVINVLWVLMEASVEELKLLQTAILLLTTNSVVQHESLAKAIVLCFRLHFTKDSTTINTAAATVRQLISVVFERVAAEDAVPSQEPLEAMSIDALKAGGKHPPKSLRPCAKDAFLLFQDLCQLVNADQPHWLVGMTEMTRTFGLDLMESILWTYPDTFLKHPEFSFLLKERVCPLVIKLFSPSLKYRQGLPAPPSPSPVDKPYFPIVMRLLRIVASLLRHYYTLLVTECEIFLSLLIKFLDSEKPMWQRALALEVLNKLCATPHLIKSFCESYDMKPHSTKIFQEIVNGLSSFIQSQFLNPTPLSQTTSMTGGKLPDTQGTPPAMVGGLPVGGGVTPQPAFYYRNVFLPLVVNITAKQGSHKPCFLEMMDRIEPPTIPEGYGLSVAFLCLLDVMRCVQSLIEGAVGDKKKETTKNEQKQKKAKEEGKTKTAKDGEEEEEEEYVIDHEAEHLKSLHDELVGSSWCGLLAALSLLLEASSDESATESILKCKLTYVNLCGRLGMTTPRDAFIMALCKASLPPHYALTVLNMQASPQSPSSSLQRTGSHTRTGSGDTTIGSGHDTIQGSQVVAVGTALPTASLPAAAQQGPVMLTAKNIQCMRAILSMAHCHGGVLGTAWHKVLTTLQHLVWILGLKPSTGGSLKATQQASESAVITTAVMADLPVLSSMLSRLFESSQYLDDVALHHLIDALCKLSSEAMELAYSNREPSLFAVAKLLETGLVNLSRVEVLWRPVTAHLLEVSQHPHLSVRSWGAEAVTSLTKAALQYSYHPPLHKQVKLQAMLLAPLQELSGIMHGDIRQKQLECVLQILHNNGETLNQGWPLVLGVIGAVTNDQGESLIRTAFQCLQLVVTDFLPVMPCTCLQVCAEVAGKFGLQNQEVNISLTAIGLLWNISDYFYQNRQKIAADLNKDHLALDQSKQGMLPFDVLWMCVYSKLGELCVDPRPAVRKSAGQTLFSTISAHGALLQQQTWQTVLWKVLFPLLDRVKKVSSTASGNKEDTKSGNILIHHSRDTAEKQWAETRVLTLAGVARVFNTKRRVLQMLGDFPRAWALLLEFIESSALCRNAEVSLAALKSFQEILHINKDASSQNDEWRYLFQAQNMMGGDLNAPKEEKILRTTSSTDDDSRSPSSVEPEILEEENDTDVIIGEDSGIDAATLWANAWRVWLSIGTAATTPPDTTDNTLLYIPSQPFLTALVQIFPAVYAHIKPRFVAADLQKLSTVFQRALSVPVHSDSSPFILPVGEVGLTPLQDAILNAVRTLQQEALSGAEELHTMYPDLFDQMLVLVLFAVKPPKFGKVEAKTMTAAKGGQADWVAMNYVPFAEGVVELVVELYKETAKHQSVVNEHVLQHIIAAFHPALSLKYGCPSQSTWILLIDSLLTILSVGLPIARKNESASQGMWTELGQTLDAFLFSQHPPPTTLSVEDYQRDEAIDCKVVMLIKEDILPFAKTVPREFIVRVMNILNKGSIHSATSTAFVDTDSSRKLREDFAKACFETLLQFSFITQSALGGSEEGSITKLAVTALLKRCREVLQKYVEDERLSGKCPLPRPRMSEMSFVLKAMSTLLMTLKRVPPDNVESSIWEQVIELYPSLVDCTTSTSVQVCKTLRDVLHEYKELLAPPTSITANGV